MTKSEKYIRLETNNTNIVFVVYNYMEDQKKNLIDETALSIFLQQGFSKTTMDEIAEKAGISKKTLYQYYPSKDEMIVSIITGWVQFIGLEVRKICDSTHLNYLQKLALILNTVHNRIPKGNSALFEDFRKKYRHIWKLIDAYRQKEIISNVGFLLNQGIQEGLIRNDIDSELLILIYTNTITNTVNPETLSQTKYSAKDAFSALVRIFFEGILTEQARKTYQLENLFIEGYIS